MSDLNDDLLNYELGDDIDDPTLFCANEDELLYSDDELDKDVSKEEKLRLKEEAEQWVKSQIAEKQKQIDEAASSKPEAAPAVAVEAEVQPPPPAEPAAPELPHTSHAHSDSPREKSPPPSIPAIKTTQPEAPSHVAAVAPAVVNTEVTSTGTGTSPASVLIVPAADDVTTSDEPPPEPKAPLLLAAPEPEPQQQSVLPSPVPEIKKSSSADEVTSSSNSKEQDVEIPPVALATQPSTSTTTSTTTATTVSTAKAAAPTAVIAAPASVVQSSQENGGVVPAAAAVGGKEFADPREDFEDEREGRTNLKITNERDAESSSTDQSPDRPRHNYTKRGGGGGGGNALPRPLRGSGYHGGLHPQQQQRPPLLRFPLTHGGFHPQNPSMNPSLNPYAMHSPGSHCSPGGGGGGGSPQTHTNTHAHNNTNLGHQHDGHNHNLPLPSPRLRHGYPGMRGGYRHQGPSGGGGGGGGMYGHDFGGGMQYSPNFAPRGMYRPTDMGGTPPLGNTSLRPGMRLQRPPLQPMSPQIGGPSYALNGPVGPGRHGALPPPQLQIVQTTAGGILSPASALLPVGAVQKTQSAGLPPGSIISGKVLINPNFKGGVEAAKSKFIQETQFMNAISNHVTHLQSDEELLRQQEEFIIKNRQHIEKRRHERTPPPVAALSRRSRTRSRSYSPGKRANVSGTGERHFERERDRDRERDRERERDRGGTERLADRARGGSRDRGATGGRPVNRFRRGRSRDREGENRDGRGGSGAGGFHGKRRRSLSPGSGRRGAENGPNDRGRRGADRERNDDEDEEMHAYRLQIEKQKALREKLMRDKELKRRRTAMENAHEDKSPAKPQNNNSNGNNNNNSTTNASNNSNNNNSSGSHENEQPSRRSQPKAEKLKPLIVTERKVISLKKVKQDEGGAPQRGQEVKAKQGGRQTAALQPEAKRTLTEHLTNVVGGRTSTTAATASPVEKSEAPSAAANEVKSCELQFLSTPSDDEVQLDFDEDELMLDEEDRLLATPTPSPPASHTPTLEPQAQTKPQAPPPASGGRGSGGSSMASSNRRVILRTSTAGGRNNRMAESESSRRGNDGGNTNAGRSRRGDGNNSARGGGRNDRREQQSSGRSSGNAGNSNNNNSNNNKRGIFDRLETKMNAKSGSSGGGGTASGGGGHGGGDTGRRRGQRIILKHD